MFICSEPHKSNEALQDLVNIQEQLFSSLGLHFRIMDMPPFELGSPAYRYNDCIVIIINLFNTDIYIVLSIYIFSF